MVVLDVRKVAEVVEESLSAVAALLGPRVVPQVVVGARVVEGAALDHVKVARAEDLVVAVVRRHGHPLVVLGGNSIGLNESPKRSPKQARNWILHRKCP